MLFLSGEEKKGWRDLAVKAIASKIEPGSVELSTRDNMRAVFNCYVGVLLSATGNIQEGKKWFRAGALMEDRGFFFNTYILSFLKRNGDRLVMPSVVFDDPSPYIHFTTVPIVKGSRKAFVSSFGHCMPKFGHPLNILDIGTGDGSMLIQLLKHLQETGKAGEISEILLVEKSRGMLENARRIVSNSFPGTQVTVVESRIEDFTSAISGHFDVAIASLSYHHMPWEQKVFHMKRLKNVMDNFVLFELDANNDTPDQNTPEMILSLHQSYGRMFDFVFEHDAPIELANKCVDNFLMSELVSFLIHPRGSRTDYHMLSEQWKRLFEISLGNEFSLLGDAICYSDEHFSFRMLHYGR